MCARVEYSRLVVLQLEVGSPFNLGERTWFNNQWDQTIDPGAGVCESCTSANLADGKEEYRDLLEKVVLGYTAPSSEEKEDLTRDQIVARVETWAGVPYRTSMR